MARSRRDNRSFADRRGRGSSGIPVARGDLPSPLEPNARLSARTGAQVWLKREDLLPVRSYKLRGAYNLISQLDESALAAGVVCDERREPRPGVAYACSRLGVRARVYLPRTTPRQKRDRVAFLGGDVIEIRVVGETYNVGTAAALADTP